jgi:hypothetical protein
MPTFDLGFGLAEQGIGSTLITEGPAPYLGLVGTRNFVPNSTFSSTGGWNSVTPFYARDDITALGIGLANWYLVAGGGETSPANVQTNFASIEYPDGVFTQIKWGGATSVALTSGQTVFSDLIPISIPRGALAKIRRYQTNTSVLLFCAGDLEPPMNTALGDKVEQSVTNKTMGGTITDSGNGAIIPISAIVGMTKRPSIAAIGSSRLIGFKDNVVDATGDSGYARLFGGSFGYVSMGLAGDSMAAVVSSGAKRMALAQACASHLWIDPGLNDLNGGGTAANVLGYINTITSQWPDKSKVIINTEGPWTTGAWSTTVGQTVKSWEAQRVALNTGIRALTGYNQIVEAADYDETARNSGFWKNPVSGGSTFTADGTHENSPTLIAMAAVGIFNPALVTR